MSYVEKKYTVSSFVDEATEVLAEIKHEWERKYGKPDEDNPTDGQEMAFALGEACEAIQALDFDDELNNQPLELGQIKGTARIKQIANVKAGVEVLRGILEQLVAEDHFEDPEDHQNAEQNFERLDVAYAQLDSI